MCSLLCTPACTFGDFSLFWIVFGIHVFRECSWWGGALPPEARCEAGKLWGKRQSRMVAVKVSTVVDSRQLSESLLYTSIPCMELIVGQDYVMFFPNINFRVDFVITSFMFRSHQIFSKIWPRFKIKFTNNESADELHIETIWGSNPFLLCQYHLFHAKKVKF